MTNISTKSISPQKKKFHNDWIDVYPTALPLSKIQYWLENNRTIFTFERLCSNTGKLLEDLSIEEVTEFVAKQDIHKLDDLSKSIARNGVQVPLIIRDDGKLLDGNRRYFACYWLEMQHRERNIPAPDSLQEIPVWVIREKDLTQTMELKILAEANFIKDLKVAWPLDAQARAVYDYFKQIKSEKKLDRDSAIEEVAGIFGIARTRVSDLLGTLTLTKEFINTGTTKDDQMKRRSIVEEKFVYFWEFVNKATKGNKAFDDPLELKEVRDMFFQLIYLGRDTPIKNVKQVEPLVQAKRDKTAWSILKESKGAKLSTVVSIMNDKKEIRKAEDKIRVFLAWLSEVEDEELTPKAKTHLRDVAALSTQKARR